MLDDGRVVEGSALIRTRLSQDPHDAEALFLMAQVARIAGNLEIALGFLTSALGRQPNRCEFLVEKASVLDGLGRVKEAISAYRDVLYHDPRNTTAVSRPAMRSGWGSQC